MRFLIGTLLAVVCAVPHVSPQIAPARDAAGQRDAQAERARRLSVSYYAQALAHAPAAWKETIDVKHRRSVMQGGDPKLIDALGWHFCAD